MTSQKHIKQIGTLPFHFENIYAFSNHQNKLQKAVQTLTFCLRFLSNPRSWLRAWCPSFIFCSSEFCSIRSSSWLISTERFKKLCLLSQYLLKSLLATLNTNFSKNKIFLFYKPFLTFTPGFLIRIVKG